MSDSSLSDGAPSEGVLEQALRNAVRAVYRSGDLDNLTVKRIRKSVEADLDLEDDFFKNDSVWKEQSKTIIQSEVDSKADANAKSGQPSSIPSPRPPPKSKKAQSNLPEPQKPNRDFRGTKRASSEKAGSNKRQKKEPSDSEGSASAGEEVPRKKAIAKSKKHASSEKTGPKARQQKEASDSYGSGSEEEGVPSKKLAKSRKSTPDFSPSPRSQKNEETGQISKHISGNLHANGRKGEASESEMSEVLDEAPKTKAGNRKSGSAKLIAKANGAKVDAADSEMSEVLDEAPKAKGRKRKSDSAKPNAKKTETLKRKKSSEQSTNPDAEEIKRLQGWLIKCGIRKMWHRELAPYDNSKAKIRHLKELLADAGMTGRYSIEKANQIKAERELQADLEAVQEGAKQWGKAESEGEDEPSGRPKRRLARGLRELDFLNDEDGEESD